VPCPSHESPRGLYFVLRALWIAIQVPVTRGSEIYKYKSIIYDLYQESYELAFPRKRALTCCGSKRQMGSGRLLGAGRRVTMPLGA
jgi:hypothetical protein